MGKNIIIIDNYTNTNKFNASSSHFYISKIGFYVYFK